MIIKLLYNLVIDLVTLVCMAFWLLLGCTIFIPALWNLTMGDYWNLKPFIEDMRESKLK